MAGLLGDITVGIYGGVGNEDIGTIDTAAGAVGDIYLESAGTIDMAIGMVGMVNNRGAGTINQAVVCALNAPENTGGGAITNILGLLIGDCSGIGAVNSINFISEGVNSTNIFEGSVEVDIALEVAGNNVVSNQTGQETGDGEYTLTNAFAVINLDTSGNMEVTLPSAGTYLINWVTRTQSYLTAVGTGQSILEFELWNTTDAALLTDSRLVQCIPQIALATTMTQTVSSYEIVTVADSKTIQLRARYTLGAGGATLGEAIIKSDNNGTSKINYVRLY